MNELKEPEVSIINKIIERDTTFSDKVKNRLEELLLDEEKPKPIVTQNEVIKEVSYEYINLIEYYLKQEIKDIVDDLSGCSCEKCLLQIMVSVLNDIKPRYILIQKGNYIDIPELPQQVIFSIKKAITEIAIITKLQNGH